MAPHSSTLAWKIPWTEEPGGLQSVGLQRVGHDWATSLSLSTFMHWRRKWQPTPAFLPGESQGWGRLVGCCPWVTQSRTQLKRLSSTFKVRWCFYLAFSYGCIYSWSDRRRGRVWVLVLGHWEYLSNKRQDACPFGTYVLVGEVLRLKNKYESVC